MKRAWLGEKGIKLQAFSKKNPWQHVMRGYMGKLTITFYGMVCGRHYSFGRKANQTMPDVPRRAMGRLTGG